MGAVKGKTPCTATIWTGLSATVDGLSSSVHGKHRRTGSISPALYKRVA
jgi:hypothetical protein